MSRFTNFLTAVIGFGFVVLGIITLGRAESAEDRLIGALCVLFFGAVGAIGLMEMMPRALPRPGAGGKIIVTVSRLRAGVLAFGGLAFLVAGIVLTALAWPGGFSWFLVISVAAIPFGLAALAFTLRQALAPGVLYVLDETGIECRNGMRWTLRWSDIADIRMGQVRNVSWLELETFEHVPDPEGWVARLNRRLGKPPYAVQAGTSGVDFGGLADAVVSMWEAHRGQGGQA